MLTRNLVASVAFTVGAITASSSVVRAQCADWSSGFGVPGFNSDALTLAVFDDGSGPALFAGGYFTSADGVSARSIAKWNGSSWSEVGGGMNGGVSALAVFDDGFAPALYATGDFYLAGEVTTSRIARWDGSEWSDLAAGLVGTGNALAVFDSGAGDELYVGGRFSLAGNMPATNLAKWNGMTGWSPIGSGTPDLREVGSLAVFDSGSGSALYVADVVGVGSPYLSRYDGTQLISVGGGFNGVVYAMTVFDDGSGSALYVGGRFTAAGGVSASRIAKWNGSTWSALGSGLNSYAKSLAVFDDGSGPALFVAGDFTTAGGVGASHIAKWDGTTWSPVGTGLNGGARALAVFDDGSGPRLVAAGGFSRTGLDTVANGFARWDGASWSGPSYQQGIDREVQSLAVYDAGAGPKLYAGGSFVTAGRLSTQGVARWEGTHWSALAGGVQGTVFALEVFDDGSGQSLFAGGDFPTADGQIVDDVARWDGTSWSALGNGFDNPVYDFTVFDDGSGAGRSLYAGGGFVVSGGTFVRRVAKWNGSTWLPLGYGLSGTVRALQVYDDGSGAGPALYVGGLFGLAGGSVPASCIARWNGSEWSAVGTGMDGLVRALAVFDDGSGRGPELYAGGEFFTAGGVSANHIAKWNGSAWSAVGIGTDRPVVALRVFDDGAGARLYAGGTFTMVDGSPANRVAKWDGIFWSALGSGTAGEVNAFAAFDDGSGGGSELYLGGNFHWAGGKPSAHIARWGACRPGAAYCFGDDFDPFVTTDCPCGNFGDSGRGCANSNSVLGGARLIAIGTTSPNTVLLTCNGVPSNTLCTFLRGSNNVAVGSLFGDGIKCLSAPLLRFGSQNSGDNGSPPHTVEAAAPNEAPGSTLYYVLQYRNPAGFCTEASFNASNGYTISW